MTTPLGAPDWAAAQAQPWLTENQAKRIIEAVARGVVEDRDLTAPPGSCADGACYLVKATATGAWASHDGEMAIAVGVDAASGWLFADIAIKGTRLEVNDEGLSIRHSGTAWIADTGYAEIYMLSNQAMPGGTEVTVQFDDEYLDVRGMWNSGTYQLTIPADLDGQIMLFSAGVQHTADGTGNLELTIEGSSNGGSSWYRVCQTALEGEQFGIIATQGFELVAAGNLYRVRHFSSAAKTIDASAFGTQFKVTVLGR